ncbi:MAG: 3-deoxy-D-manno-octulosonic acid transferase [bacterium]
MAPSTKSPAVYLYQWLLDGLYWWVRLFTWAKKSSFRERLGFYPPRAREALESGSNFWLHAASAGEVNAILPFARVLKEKTPTMKLILTTTSETGKKLALDKKAADEVFLAPLDMTRPLRRAFQAFRPEAVLVAETEIWPNWLFRAVRNQVPVLLINGRISDKSFPTYRKLKFLFGPALRCFNQCLVQTEGDRDKLIELGLPEKRIQVAGQMKYDLEAPTDEGAREWGAALGVQKGDELAAFGSLRDGEEDLWAAEIPGLLERHPRLKIFLAPRHVKNAETYQAKLFAVKVESVLRSRVFKGQAFRVLVMDTVGELSLAYHLSRVAFVGGTLVPIGGHNLMEPALSSVPVLFGPYTRNVSEAGEALKVQGGGFQASNVRELTEWLEKLLDPKRSQNAGEKARRAVEALRGATEKNLKVVEAYLPSGISRTK